MSDVTLTVTAVVPHRSSSARLHVSVLGYLSRCIKPVIQSRLCNKETYRCFALSRQSCLFNCKILSVLFCSLTRPTGTAPALEHPVLSKINGNALTEHHTSNQSGAEPIRAIAYWTCCLCACCAGRGAFTSSADSASFLRSCTSTPFRAYYSARSATGLSWCLER